MFTVVTFNLLLSYLAFSKSSWLCIKHHPLQHFCKILELLFLRFLFLTSLLFSRQLCYTYFLLCSRGTFKPLMFHFPNCITILFETICGKPTGFTWKQLERQKQKKKKENICCTYRIRCCPWCDKVLGLLLEKCYWRYPWLNKMLSFCHILSYTKKCKVKWVHYFDFSIRLLFPYYAYFILPSPCPWSTTTFVKYVIWIQLKVFLYLCQSYFGILIAKVIVFIILMFTLTPIRKKLI